MKKYTIVAAMFLVLGAVIGAIVLFGGEKRVAVLKKDASNISYHVEISYRAPEGATWVTFLSSWTSWGWDEAAKSTDRRIVVSYNLSAGKYIFNLNYGGVAPYWACTGSPSLANYPARMVGGLEVRVDGQPVKVELEDNHQGGCNLQFYTGWCGNNPELCAQVIVGISAGFAVEIAHGNILGL